MEEASKHVGGFLETRECTADDGRELIFATESHASDSVVLHVLPYPLIGIEFR